MKEGGGGRRTYGYATMNFTWCFVTGEWTKASASSQTETHGRDPPCHHRTIMLCA